MSAGDNKKMLGLNGPKPSGLKPPSTLGRLCSNQEPKPAVPPSPPRGSGDASTATAAAPRMRSPLDSSVVLTEDTDSFKIGDRIWVGGTKPGIIAYIGETQFAPGEWAGVVLDKPIGKNDGSVANIRYFQCDPKRGVFSRLTRLTKSPLSAGGEDHSFLPTNLPSRPPSSTGSRAELSVGDRVIVMSSTGSKTGMLRYIGLVNFSQGEWCGVELDDPIGKNDGSVQGKRYFQCQPKYGLFAPTSKVSLSPSPNRRASCAMHPPGPVRQTTKDSITSSTSTASRRMSRPTTPSKPLTALSTGSNTAQGALKDKEAYIEQLLKERDMERVAITQAAQQAEAAERDNDNLKQQLRQLQETSEAVNADLQHQLLELQRENQEMKNHLEEERGKLDDLTFRLDEEGLARTELDALCKQREEQIKLLEERLVEETKRFEVLETESSKMFEAEEALTSNQAKLEDAKELLKEQQEQAVKWSKLYEEEKQQRIEIESYLGKVNEVKTQLETDVRTLTVKSGEIESLLVKSDLECTRLKEEMEQISNNYFTENASLNKRLVEVEEKYKNLQDENNIKINEISLLNFNLSQIQDKLKIKEDEITSLKTIHDEEVLALKKKINELENTLTSKTVAFEQQEDLHRMEINDLKEILMKSEKEKEEKDKNNLRFIEEEAKNSATFSETLQKKDEEIIKLKNQIDHLNVQLETEVKRIKHTEERNQKLNDNVEQLKAIEQTSKRFEEKIQNLMVSLDSQSQALVLKEEELCESKAINEDLKRSASDLHVQVEEWKRNYEGLEEKCHQITEQKVTLENRLSELMSSSSDSSLQLVKLNDIVREKEAKSARLQEELLSAQQERDIALLKLQHELDTTKDKAKTESEDMQKKLLAKEKELEIALSKCRLLETDFQGLTKTYKQLDNDFNECKTKLDLESGLKFELQKKLSEESKLINSLKNEIQEKIQDTNKTEEEWKINIKNLEEEKNNLKTELDEWKSQCKKTAMDMDTRIKNEESLKEKIADIKTEKEKLVSTFEEKITSLTDCLDKISVEKEKFQDTICEKDVEILQLRQNLDKMGIESQKLSEDIKIKETKINEISVELENMKLSSTNLLNSLKIEKDDSSKIFRDKLDSLSRDVEKLKQEKESIEKLNCDKDNELHKLTKTVEELKLKSESQHTELKLKENQVEEIIKQLENKSLLNEKILASAAEAKEKLSKLEKELSERKVLNDISLKLESDYELLKEERNQTLNQIEKLTSEVKKLSGDNETLMKQFESMKEENDDLRKQLLAKPEKITNIAGTNNNNTNEPDSNATIAFLNSIIADQQKELQIMKEENQMLKSHGDAIPAKSTRINTPRLFCDICDCFDLHDTEDCPTQGSDSPPPSRTRHQRKPVAERPYCESCEVFGHVEGDCDDETY